MTRHLPHLRHLLATALGATALAVVPTGAVSAAPGPLALGPTGPIGLVETELDTSATPGVGEVATAYHPGSGRFLTAWTGTRLVGAVPAIAAKQEVLGRWVDAETGAPDGAPFVLASIGDTADPTQDAVDPSLAWDAASSRFVIVYAGDTTSDGPAATFDATDFRVFVRTLDPDDDSLSAPAAVETTGAAVDQRRPDVAVNGAFARVAWEVVATSGASTVRTVALAGAAPSGTPVAVTSDAPGADSAPAVAVSAGGQALVVWTGLGNTGGGPAPRAFGARVGPTNTVVGTNLLGEVVNNAAYEENGVDVATSQGTSWWVVFSSNTVAQPDAFVVRGQLVSEQGGGLDGAGVLALGNQAGDDLAPAVTTNSDNQVIVAWVARNGTDHQVWASRLSGAGVSQDLVRLSEARGAAPNVQPTGPAISWSEGSIGTSSVVWGDDSAWSRLLGGPVTDTTRPSVTLTAPTGPLNAAFTVTATFSEPVTGLTAADFGVTNGVASNLQAVSTTVYTVTITPTADGDVVVSLPEGAAADSSANTSTAAAPLSRVFDGIRPGVTLSAATGPFNAPFRVAVGFTEPVTGLAAGDFVGGNATISDLQGSGASYSVLVTPTAQGVVQVDLPQNTASDAAGNGNTAATALTRLYDAQAPTVTLSAPAGPFNAPFTVSIGFSESVTGLALGDLTVTNATLSDLVGSGSSYTVLVTPSAEGAVAVTLPAGSVADAAGNGNQASSVLTRQYDTTRPTATLTAAAGPFNAPFTVSLSFSEPVTGLTATDVQVTNGTAGSLAGSGTAYTVVITPTSSGTVTVALPAGAAADAAGNDNLASGTVTRTYDAVQPTIGLTAPTGPFNAPFTVTGTFSEPVTGFTVEDLVLGGCTASDLQVSGTGFTVLLTRASDGDCSVSVEAGAVADAAGNPNPASSTLTRTVDLTQPSLTLSAPAGPVDGAFTVTLSFSEPVTGLTLADVGVTGGTASDLGGSGSTYTVLVTPTGDGPVVVSVAGGAAVDAAGNLSEADSLTRTADLTDPTATLEAPAGPFNTSFDVTISFSEPVTGLTGSDLVVTNGVAANLTGTGPYTVTIIPTTDGPVSVTLPGDAVSDAAGNGNPASATLTRAYDATAPELSITPAPGQPDPVRADQVVFVVDASEPVSDLAVADVTVGGTSGATAAAVSRVDPDTFEVTVTGMTTTGTVLVSTVVGAVADPAGNVSAASSSPVVAWALTRPPVIVAVFDQTCFDRAAEVALRLRTDDGSTLSVSSNNLALLPRDRITLTRTGSDLVLRVRPVPSESGNARVRVTATNEAGTSSFAVRVGVGTSGRDEIIDSALNDIILGRGGNDLLRGNVGSDLICGGNGNDRIRGGVGRDSLYGQDGDDTLIGNQGPDKIVGGPGSDTVIPGALARAASITRLFFG